MVGGSLRPIMFLQAMTLEVLEKWLPREKVRGFGSRTPTSYVSGTMWPHGEFSYGYGKRRPDGGEWHEDPFVGLGVDDVAMAERADRPLYLSDAPNSTNRPPRGLKGITGYGQQMIKACGFLMEERFPRHRKTFGTVTLPPMPQEMRAELVRLWPDLTRELLRWVSRRLERQGLPPLVCSVCEVQPKRLAALGEAYLHWHLIWLNHPGRKGNWAVDPVEMSAWLVSLLERKIRGLRCGHVNVNVKPVAGEAARYLAKYMSKGRQAVTEAMQDWGADNCPKTWWNMTAKAREMVNASVRRGEAVGQLLEGIFYHAQATGWDDYYAFLRPIEMDFDGVSVILGWRGRLHPEVREDVRAMLNCD